MTESFFKLNKIFSDKKIIKNYNGCFQYALKIAHKFANTDVDAVNFKLIKN